MLLARALALLAIMFWGISFVATKIALRELAPVPLIVGRFAIGLVILVAIVIFVGKRRLPAARDWPELVLLGFLGVFVHQLLQANALRTASAVNTGWLIGITPIWSAILAVLFLGERLSPVRVTGFLIGFAGALLVVTGGRFDASVIGLPSTQGDFLILASTFNWAVCTVLSRRALARHGALVTTTAGMIAGWLMLLPIFALESGPAAFAGLSRSTWVAVLFLGILCSGLGYLFWYGALEKLGASSVSAFLYLEPLVTLAAAALLLGESVRLPTVIGGLLVLLGVVLAQRVNGRAPPSD